MNKRSCLTLALKFILLTIIVADVAPVGCRKPAPPTGENQQKVTLNTIRP
jgi:hypothetical protein